EVSIADADDVTSLKTTLKRVANEVSALKQDRSAIQNDLEKSQMAFEKAEKSFARGGGEHWENREEIKNEEQSLDGKKQVVLASLHEFAFGSLPLTLLSDLVSDIEASDKTERDCEKSAIVETAIEDYKNRLVKKLKKNKVPQSTLELIKGLHQGESPSDEGQEGAMLGLRLSEQARGQIYQLLGKSREDLAKKAKASADEFENLQSKLDSVKRSLAATPQEKDIRQLSEVFKTSAKELGKVEQRASSLDQRVIEKTREYEELQKQLENKLLKSESDIVKASDANRMASLAGRTRDAMQEFLKRSTSAKIDRLSEFIYESFQYLLRKKSLVEGVQIDPESFEITLISKDGSLLPKQRLSEGEKQIFAISVLWGLARASNRRLPAIIDTPMGRLDSAHRDNLLKLYFPKASHQTVILSTDTEVDERYFNLLEPNITRAYSLRYNERKRETKVEEGYFWKTDKIGATS
ncbi:DNA sulfur modification protein DndD, partial [Mariniblastus sp.]|nr:DNA sulfur modification protein DndD [Mariniblastus sp.]